MKVFAWKKKATSLLKTVFLMTLNPKEKLRVIELKKYLKIGVKLELLEKLKFENWSFKNYL